MLKNYIKLAWRNLMKNKGYSFINISGLAVGMLCCMLITFYIYHELNYDKFYNHADRLYQVGTVFVKEKEEHRSPNTPSQLGGLMKQVFPQVEETTRLLGLFAEDKTLFQYFEKNGTANSFYESKGYMADSTFFRLFNYEFSEGDPHSALARPYSVVLSEEIANKLFGNQPALSRTIHISSNTNGDHDYLVSGVFRPAKRPGHIDGRFYLSLYGGNMWDYIHNNTNLAGNNMFFTYLLLKPGTDVNRLQSALPAFVDKYEGKDLKAMGFYKKQFLLPVKDIHLHANMDSDVTPVAGVTYLYILACIAAFTLMIACINFMNLSTARSSKRSAEVGVRKVLGAEKKSLVRQFLGESVLMAMIAFIFAYILSQLFLPGFEILSGKQFLFTANEKIIIWSGFFILAIITGLLAGVYPAFYLSSFKPVKVLKGKISNSFSAVFLRKGLVIFQFVISAVLIIASVMISRQMNFLRTTDLGFVKDKQIVVPLRTGNAKKIYTSLRNELSKDGQVVSTGASLYYPGIFNPSDNGFYREGQTINNNTLTRLNWVDANFLQTIGIKAIAGRLFSENFPTDTSNAIILNESAIHQMGFKTADDAVGKKVFSQWQGTTYNYNIIGVVKDFHFEDLHVPISPYGFELNNKPQFNYVVVHSRASDIGQTIALIGKHWHELDPDEPFEYSFLDQDFQKNYNAENRLSGIVGYFTGIAIIISCLGLFGLAAFSAEQRTKEIGIRKVLGATVSNILRLLSMDFLKLVLAGVFIASPISWYIMNKWLQGFSYRTNFSWGVLAVSIGFALLIAIITISFQAIKSAMASPIKNLRTE